MINTREYNNRRFSIYDSEEKTALSLMNELGQACNEVLNRADEVEKQANDNKVNKVSYDDLQNNYQLTTDGANANFDGTWQGLNRPTLSDEGMRATVEDIIDNKIPSIETSLVNINRTINGEINLNDKFNGANFFLGDQGTNYSINKMIETADNILKTNIRDLFLVIYMQYKKDTNELVLVNSIDFIKSTKEMLVDKGFKIVGYKFHVSGKNDLSLTDTSWFTEYKSIILNVVDNVGGIKVKYCNLYNEFTDIAARNNFKDLFTNLNQELKDRGYKTFHSNTISGTYSSKVLDIVDMIGVNMYPAISDKMEDTTLADCIRGWHHSFDGEFEPHKIIQDIKNKFKVPVVISELGMPPTPEAFMNPENYNYDLTDIDYRSQALFYEGFFNAFKDFDFNGYFVWDSTSLMFSPFKGEETINVINKYVREV